MGEQPKANAKAGAPAKPEPPGPLFNNPGNIEYHKSIPWLGLAKEQPGRFARFTDRLLGLRAMVLNTINDQRNEGDWTLRALITRLSPFKENKTATMIAHVAEATGKKADEHIDLRHDPALLLLTVRALIIEEVGHSPGGGAWYTDVEIGHAIEQAVQYVDEHHPDPPPKSTTPKQTRPTPRDQRKVEPLKKPTPDIMMQIEGAPTNLLALLSEDDLSDAEAAEDWSDDESSDETESGSGDGQLAARISDHHDCPLVTASVPHVGGPVKEGSPNVHVGGQPAARLGDCLACTGALDAIASGSKTVYINGRPAARVTDTTEHGGVLASGAATVHFA